MPKFSNEQIGQRQPVQTDTQNNYQTEVVARPTNTYVAPAENDLMRLSKSLESITPGLNKALELKQHADNQEEVSKGAAAQLRGDALPPEATPWYQHGFKSMYGTVQGNALDMELRKAASDHQADPNFDPKAFAQKFITEKTQGISDPVILKSMNAQLSQGVAAIQGDFLKYQLKQQRDDEAKLGAQTVELEVFKEPGDPKELRARYDAVVEKLKASNFDTTRTDLGAIFARQLLARAYAGDPEAIKAAEIPGKDGFSLKMTHPELYTEVAKAQAQAIGLYDRKQLQESQQVNAAEAGEWEQKINTDPGSFGNAFDFFMKKWSKYGNIRDEATFLHWANKATTAQEQWAKTQGHMFNVEANPALAGVYMADEKFKKQFNEAKFAPIWQSVDQNQPGSVISAIQSSLQVMKTYQGSEDPYLKSYFDRALMSLNVDPKTKIENAPAQFVSAAQAYKYMEDNGMGGFSSKLFDDRMGLALRQFSAFTGAGEGSSTAFQKVLQALKPENEKRALNLEDRTKMKTEISGALRPWLGKNYDMNGEELTNKALFLADSLYKSTNMDGKEIRDYVLKSMETRLVDVGAGKVYYAPQGNVDGLPSQTVFKTGANQLIQDYITANPKAGDVTLTPYADGKSFGIVNKNREVVEVVSIDDIKKGYDKATYATGSITGDVQEAGRIRALLNSKGGDMTFVEMSQLQATVDRLEQSKAISHKERTEFTNLRDSLRQKDMDKASEFIRTMKENQGLFQQGRATFGDDYRTDVANPGGNNLRTVDYALDFAKRGDLTTSMTMLGEGLKLGRYKDPNGKDFNIGVGYNMTAHGKEGTFKALTAAGVPKENLEGVWGGSLQITPDQAMRLHKYVVKHEIEPIARKAFGAGFDSLPANARAVITDLAYAAGGKVADFKGTMELMRQGKFEEAGKGLKLTYLNDQGQRVEDTRRMGIYQRLLAGEPQWISYLNELGNRTKK